MTKFLPLADLEAVVLDRRLVARVEWPDSDVAEGRGVSDAFRLGAALFVASGISSSETGMRIDVKNETAEVQFGPTPGLSLVTAYSDASVVATDDERLFTSDLSQSRLVCELSDGRLIELAWSSEQAIVVSVLMMASSATPALLPPAPAVLDGNRDEWLCDIVRAHWAAADDWHTVVAAGIALTNTTADGRSWTEFTVEASWPHVWFRQTTPEQRNAVADSAVAAVTMLREDFDDLDEAFDPGDEGWRAALIDWCRRRDDLEGVVMLLDWMRGGTGVHDVLDSFDAEAAAFVRAIPVVFDVDDEQLRRAGRFNPEAWWSLQAE